MPIWTNILLATVLLVFLIIYEWRWKEKIRIKSLQIAVTVVTATIVAPLVFALLSTWSNRIETKKEEAFRSAVLSTLQTHSTETSTLKDIVQFRYKEIFDSTETEAENWTKSFLESLEKRRAQANVLEKDTQELGRRLALKWQPFYGFTLLDLDTKVSELSKHTQISVESKEAPDLLIINSVATSRTQIRSITFPSGSKLLVEVDAGVLDRGKLTRYPSIVFRALRDGNPDIIFYLSFYEDHIKAEIDLRHSPSIGRDEFRGDLLSADNRMKLKKYISYSIEWLFI
jgi:hypothetical protein